MAEGRPDFTLADIAAQLGGDVLGDAQTRVSRIAPLDAAGPGDISFLSSRKYRNLLQTTSAAAVILAPDAAEAFAGPRIVTGNPYAYYARLAGLMNPPMHGFDGVHVSASLASQVPLSAAIGAGVSIGRDVVIGERVVLYPGCVVQDGAAIGDDSVLYPNVSVYHGCQIGQRAIIHSGAVIGSDGFGFAPDGMDWVKIPQLGIVRIGDDVEIGANSAVDRGTLSDTVIGDGCKIDNLVHIAHNCQIGARTVLAGCTGIAGSTTLGEHCIVGGAGMISGHLNIAGGTTVSGGSLVMKNILKPGVYTSVFPLDTHDEWLRNASHIRRLSKLADRISELEKKLEKINTGD